MSGPQILTIDIETTPISAYVWALFDQNIGLDQIKEEWSILAYAAKWLGDKEIIYEDTSGRGPEKVRDDLHLLASIWNLLDEADIVVAQNGRRFDIRKINARLLMAGFGPYSPIRVIDTLSVAKRYFGFSSNKLAWLSKYLTNTPKSDHRKFPSFELWVECLKDNSEAWKEMEKYNKRDVIATEKLYLRQRPWITNHPNIGTYTDSMRPECPKCGSKKVQKRGHALTQNGRYARFHCQSCGGWSRAKQTELSKEERETLLV
jgi:hypothetical protein